MSERVSTLRRLRFTPLRDVMRGRLSGALDPLCFIEDAGLDGRLAALAQDVVRRTRLWRRERMDVARELVAHFRDAERDAMDHGGGGGGDAGAVAAAIAASFGDARTAARLIRRAKKRSRGRVWKTTVWTARVAGAVVLLAVVWYGWAAARYFTGRPNVAVDYVGRLNAPILATPEGDRAWPEYKAAWLAAPSWGDSKAWNQMLGAWPGDPDWPEAREWVIGYEDQIERVRRASRRARLGYLLSPRADPEIAGVEPESAASGDGALFELPLEYLSSLRHLAGWLMVDASVASEEHDGARALSDVESNLRLATHTLEHPWLISQFISATIVNMTVWTVERVLAEDPGLWSDEQLAALAHALGAYRGGDYTPDLSYTQYAFRDLMQRTYTDDGHGGGHLTYRGADVLQPLFERLSGESEPDANVSIALAPAAAALVGSRREIGHEFDRQIAYARAQALVPMWELDATELQRGDDETDEHPLASLRYAPLRSWVPSVARMRTSMETTAERVGGIVLTIALERYRRDHDAYPSDLDALVPHYLPSLPLDRHVGGPLHMCINDEGKPVVYSFGTDRDDDGGTYHYTDEGRPSRWGTATFRGADEVAGWSEGLRSEWDGDWILFPPPEREYKDEAH